jgi:hypothetical protein
MINGHDLGRLIELAFDYVSTESEQQAALALRRDEAAKLATEETITFKVWLELIEYIREWNSSNGHNYPMSWASALLFLSTRQAELELSPIGPHE